MERVILILLLLGYTCINAGTLRGDTLKDINETEIREEFFNDKNIIYKGQHEIVKIYTPIFLMNLQENQILFFVEADRNNDGTKIDRGLYVKVDNSITKILDNGRDVNGDGLGNVYIAASDGVYRYDGGENRPKKYGSLSESLISIAAENNTGVIYALSENNVLYTFTTNDAKANIDNNIHDAQEIAIDLRDDSLYYYDIHKNAYVRPKDGSINKIQGLPSKPSSLQMVKAPIMVDGMVFIVNDDPYLAFSNGTSIILSTNNNAFKQFKPTAYSLEAGVMLYYGHEKNIYEYNILAKILSSMFQKLSNWLNEKIQAFNQSMLKF